MADGRDGAVTLAYVCDDTVQYSWHRCISDLISHDVAHEARVIRGGEIGMRYGSGSLEGARNDTVRSFLTDGRADWLWWVDTDMGFAPDTIDRLFEAADPDERPIVGGLCFFNRIDGGDGMGGYRTTVVPTLYDWTTDQGQTGYKVRWGYQPDRVERVAGTGSACILIHRSVFEKIAQHPENGAWYDRVPNTTSGQLIGEDLAFCLRAGALEIPVHVHTGVKTTHFKPMWLSEDHYAEQMLLNSIRERLAAEVEQRPEPAA